MSETGDGGKTNEVDSQAAAFVAIEPAAALAGVFPFIGREPVAKRSNPTLRQDVFRRKKCHVTFPVALHRNPKMQPARLPFVVAGSDGITDTVDGATLKFQTSVGQDA